MAHIKTGTTTKGNRDSVGKRRGIKKYGGEKVISGNIIARQKGTKFHPGNGTRMGKDFTIYSVKEGSVQFIRRLGDTFITVI